MDNFQEKQLAQQFFELAEKETRGLRANFDYGKDKEAEFRNIPIKTLITDPYFLNLGDHIYPSHLEDIEALFEERKTRPINLALFQESIGCIAGDSWVYTNRGPKRIKDICLSTIVGEYAWKAKLDILTPTGLETTSHFKKTGLEKTKKITTRFGYSIEGTLDHPLEVISNGKVSFKRLSDLGLNDYVAIDKSKKIFGTSDELSEDLGYLMGYMIGDGCIKDRGFNATCHIDDKEIIDKISEILEEYFEGATIKPKSREKSHLLNLRSKVNSNDGIVKFIKKYDLAHLTKDKIVPEIIFSQRKEIIKAFLNGLFDADGSFGKDRFSISAKNKNLLIGVQNLILNFGIISRIALKNCTYQNGKTICWRLNISGEDLKLFYEEIGFQLRRKQDKLADFLKLNKKNNTNFKIIPNILKEIKEIVKEAPFNRGKGDRYRFYKVYIEGRENFSYEKLRKFLNTYINTGAEESWNKLDKLLKYSENLIWLPIKEIEDSENICYDFTVPSTGNFIANGFASKNSGKSLIASILIWLQWYEVATIADPQSYFNLTPNSTIAFMTLSRTEAQSKRVIFSEVYKRFQTGFNKDYFPPNPRYSKEISIEQNNTVVYAGTSSELSILGYNLYCVSHDSKIKTPEGEKELKDLINKGELDIIGFNGKDFIETKAMNVLDSGEKEIFEVEFDDGSIIKCTENHKFLTYTKKKNSRDRFNFKYKRLKDIDENDQIFSDKDFVKCEICNELYSRITQTHLNSHNVTIMEYKDKFPNASILCESKSIEIGKKISGSLKDRDFSDEHKKNLSNAWTIERKEKVLTQRIQINCKTCNKSIYIRASKLNKKKYCSIECKAKALSIKYKGSGNPRFGKPPAHGKRIEYKGIFFRSSWEVDVAKFLDRSKIIWKYEPETFKVSDDLTYTPDFLLIEYGLYLEVKGYFRRPSQLEKFNLFASIYKVMLVRKKQMKDLNSIIRYINENNIKKIAG